MDVICGQASQPQMHTFIFGTSVHMDICPWAILFQLTAIFAFCFCAPLLPTWTVIDVIFETFAQSSLFLVTSLGHERVQRFKCFSLETPVWFSLNGQLVI